MTPPNFRLEPIVDLVSEDTLGFELLAGADRCPDWSDAHWRVWYAQMAELFCAHIPATARVFVNVHGHQALDPVVIEGVAAIHGRDRIVLEWTERIDHERQSADSCKAAAAAFVRLQQAGFSLAIDDVGAGYDGLGRALRVQPAFAKLDMSLVHLARRVDSRYLRDLRDLFEGIGAVVIAEGIESSADLERVRAAGIRYGQGYYFTRGMERAEMTGLPTVSGQTAEVPILPI